MPSGRDAIMLCCPVGVCWTLVIFAANYGKATQEGKTPAAVHRNYVSFKETRRGNFRMFPGTAAKAFLSYAKEGRM